MKRKPKRKKSIFLRIFILGVCAYFLVTLGGLLGKLNESKAKLQELKLEYEQKENTIAELKALLNAEDDSKIIEKAARERLGYIYSNEQVFIDISGS
jgi:cell division protein FtsB